MPTFSEQAMTQPFFVRDLDGFADKLANCGGLLKKYWSDFQQYMMSDGTMREQMIYLLALLDEGAADEGALKLRDDWRMLTQKDTDNDFQFHPWVRGGHVTRRVAFFDWLAHRGCWSATDTEQAAEAFIGFAFKHSLQTMTSRIRHSDNQIWSMCLNCAVTGFVFGYKLSDHPTARHLFDVGAARLAEVIGLFPRDGYAGEGSSYTSHVNTPMACWTAEFLGQVLGRDISADRFRPNGTQLRSIVEMELRIVSPGGLMAPWDHKSWRPPTNASAFAYLAGLKQDPRHLSLIAAMDLWSSPGALAWGADDLMWTLLWWPEQFKDYDESDLPEGLFGWCLPRTGAALDDCRLRSRLMQVWDRCGDALSMVGRHQVNPNHIMFEIGGEPVFQDGVSAQKTWDLPLEKVLAGMSSLERDRHERYMNSVPGEGTANWDRFVKDTAPGLLCGASAIVVDDEVWYWPGGSRTGRAEFYGAEDGLQVVTADAADYYRPQYDVRQMRRTSIWFESGFGLVLDTIEAHTTHKWTWQCLMRPFLTLDGDSARMKLPSDERILFAWQPGPQVVLEELAGFPSTYEKRCQRLALCVRGESAQFVFVIAPGARSATVRRDADTVEVKIDGETHRLVVENFNAEGPPFSCDGIELAGRIIDEPEPDVIDLEDITDGRESQIPQLQALIKGEPAPLCGSDSPLGRIDACLAQILAENPDIDLLMRELESRLWTVQVAAADALGLMRVVGAAPALRHLLTKEHAIPVDDLYPPIGAGGEREAKRWRLKTALIVALGRLADCAAVPLIGRIIADNKDFYPVNSVAAQALGRIGGPGAAEALAPALLDAELNTRVRAKHARAAISPNTAQ